MGENWVPNPPPNSLQKENLALFQLIYSFEFFLQSASFKKQSATFTPVFSLPRALLSGENELPFEGPPLDPPVRPPPSGSPEGGLSASQTGSPTANDAMLRLPIQPGAPLQSSTPVIDLTPTDPAVLMPPPSSSSSSNGKRKLSSPAASPVGRHKHSRVSWIVVHRIIQLSSALVPILLGKGEWYNFPKFFKKKNGVRNLPILFERKDWARNSSNSFEKKNCALVSLTLSRKRIVI